MIVPIELHSRRTFLGFLVAPLWDSSKGFFFRSREWPLHCLHLESVDSMEKLDPLNNKECLIMGCNILASLRPP